MNGKEKIEGLNREGAEDAAIYECIHSLVAATLEDQASPESQELAVVLAEDSKAMEVYVEYMQETAFLRSGASSQPLDGPMWNIDRVSEARRPSQRVFGVWLAIAASVGAVTFAAWSRVASLPVQLAANQETATVVRTTDVVWSDEADHTLSALTRVGPDRQIEFLSGQIEMVFDSGVELLVTGPASLRIDSPSLVVAKRGTYWARVGEGARGFTIDTPASMVVDLGTEFGVSIQGDDATQVAVFDGEVDVTPSEGPALSDPTKPIRLVQGEAIDISRNGQLHRVVTMHPDEYPTPAAKPGVVPATQDVILDVTDNLSGPEDRKYYRIVRGGFGEDALAFVDRHHEWNGLGPEGLPGFLIGADYVMPFNDDKFLDDLRIRVQLGSACMLYVLFDANMPVPEWLNEGFTNTGMSVGLDHGDGPYTRNAVPEIGPGAGIDDRFVIWSRRIEKACEVDFGGGREPEDKLLGWNMFGVVVAPLPPESAHL